MSSVNERAYAAKDFVHNVLSERTCVAIIRRQMSRWPEANFNPSKIRKDVLQARILSCGFTTPNVAGPLPDPAAQRGMRADEDDNSAHPESPAPPVATVYRSLELFIEDLREQPSNKSLQSLELPSAGDLDGGEWLVDGTNLAVLVGWFEARLFPQYDAEIFVGPVKLSFDDPMHPGWKRHCVKTSGSAVLADTSTSPAVLQVPANPCLEIFVEDSAPASTVRKRERSVSDGDGSLPTTGSSEVTPAKKRTTRPDADDVQYLINVLSELPDYSKFKEDRGERLNNKDRVSFWNFAAAFSAEFRTFNIDDPY
ncbi:hypothetical protein FB451DRAFT_1187868 [Mycena latifolia]|nr:hypothetical protein FB451DRAFT_1187868 [Mycena latifolia]